MFIDSLTIALYLAAFTSVFTLYAYTPRRKQPSHPLGPSGWPIVGNLKVPEETAVKFHRQWGEQHGRCSLLLSSPCADFFAGTDIVHLNVLGMNIIVTNILETSADLLNKRSLTYSNRPTHGVTTIRDLYVLTLVLRAKLV